MFHKMILTFLFELILYCREDHYHLNFFMRSLGILEINICAMAEK